MRKSKQYRRCFSALDFCKKKIGKVLILCIIVIVSKNANAEKKDGVFRKFTNSFLNASVIASSYVKHFMDCAMICLMEDVCLSFNIATTSAAGRTECQLLSLAASHPNTTMYGNELYNHYSRKDEKVPCSRITDVSEPENSCIIKSTCREIKTAFPSSPNDIYVIDPDGNGGEPPIEVFCDMVTRDGVGVTVVSHDSEERICVEGFNDPGSYSRKVNYPGVTLPQLRAITSLSSHCEQFAKYECYDSGLYQTPEWYGWVVSRDGQKWTPWAGATPGTEQCACANTNSCAGGKKCNCEMNDDEWREDSGVFTDRSKLPVIEMKFGDTGPGEKGYHTLGKLECY